VLGGSALTLLIVNIAFTFAVPGISIGGHLGGLAGGALCILAFSQLGRRSAVYGRMDVLSLASIAAVGLLSLAVAYWKVKGYT
jgi:membrane associated rhomboid family serine protease